MRIIAGVARGRPLQGPSGPGLRPTSDRVRESIFNILGQWLDGLAVLDLFAGTGALGLESLSRGAARAVLVDSGREALALCAKNGQSTGLDANLKVVRARIDETPLRSLAPHGPFELVFADPPYGSVSPAQILGALEVPGLLAPAARIVVEHDRRDGAPQRHGGFERVDQRLFGDTAVSFYVRAIDSAEKAT